MIWLIARKPGFAVKTYVVIFLVAPPPPSSGSKRKATSKKTRCGTCKGCQNFDRLSDCKSCRNCLDQKRYGGPGKLKKACLRRLSCDVVCKGNTKTQTTSRQQGIFTDTCIVEKCSLDFSKIDCTYTRLPFWTFEKKTQVEKNSKLKKILKTQALNSESWHF